MVRKNEREPSRFETADVALALATHTYNITSNPKNIQWLNRLSGIIPEK